MRPGGAGADRCAGGDGPRGHGAARAARRASATRCSPARATRPVQRPWSQELRDRWGDRVSRGVPAPNAEAAVAPGDLVVIATHLGGGRRTTAKAHAAALAGKVVISMGNGLERVGREFHVVLPDGDSIAAGGAGRGARRPRRRGVPPRARRRVRRARRPDRERRHRGRRRRRRPPRRDGPRRHHPGHARVRRRLARERDRARGVRRDAAHDQPPPPGQGIAPAPRGRRVPGGTAPTGPQP